MVRARLAIGAALTLCLTGPAWADENGASIYLLGTGGPGAAVMPPLPGVFLDNTFYIYSGGTSSQKDFEIGGNVVADVDAGIPASFTTIMAVPSTNFLGGTFAVAGVLPVGGPMIDARAVLTGPLGRTLDVKAHDSALVVGDPLISTMLGWKSGNLHINASTFVNIPVGNYRGNRLANLAFHRWAGDVSLAASLHDVKKGYDISAKVGVTFNGRNELTDYNSGNDLHIEAAAEKTLSPQFSAGVYGYQFFQISDDTGSGAKLGPYRGEVTGVGATVAYNTIWGRSPTTWRLRVGQEFWEKNRMSGTAVMLSLSLPLSMKMPPH